MRASSSSRACWACWAVSRAAMTWATVPRRMENEIPFLSMRSSTLDGTVDGVLGSTVMEARVPGTVASCLSPTSLGGPTVERTHSLARGRHSANARAVHLARVAALLAESLFSSSAVVRRPPGNRQLSFTGRGRQYRPTHVARVCVAVGRKSTRGTSDNASPLELFRISSSIDRSSFVSLGGSCAPAGGAKP